MKIWLMLGTLAGLFAVAACSSNEPPARTINAPSLRGPQAPAMPTLSTPSQQMQQQQNQALSR